MLFRVLGMIQNKDFITMYIEHPFQNQADEWPDGQRHTFGIVFMKYDWTRDALCLTRRLFKTNST